MTQPESTSVFPGSSCESLKLLNFMVRVFLVGILAFAANSERHCKKNVSRWSSGENETLNTSSSAAAPTAGGDQSELPKSVSPALVVDSALACSSRMPLYSSGTLCSSLGASLLGFPATSDCHSLAGFVTDDGPANRARIRPTIAPRDKTTTTPMTLFHGVPPLSFLLGHSCRTQMAITRLWGRVHQRVSGLVPVPVAPKAAA